MRARESWICGPTDSGDASSEESQGRDPVTNVPDGRPPLVGERDLDPASSQTAVRLVWDVGTSGLLLLAFACALLAILLASGRSPNEYLVSAGLAFVAFSLPWSPLKVDPGRAGDGAPTLGPLRAVVRRALISKWSAFLVAVVAVSLVIPGVARTGGILLGVALAQGVVVAVALRLERRSGTVVVGSGDERMIWTRERVVLAPRTAPSRSPG